MLNDVNSQKDTIKLSVRLLRGEVEDLSECSDIGDYRPGYVEDLLAKLDELEELL